MIHQILYLLSETFEKGIFVYFKDKIEDLFYDGHNKKNVKSVANKIMSLSGLREARKLDMFFSIITPFYIIIYESKKNLKLHNFLKYIIESYPLTNENKQLAEKNQ